MIKYLDRMGRKFSLFDAPLVYNFSQISKTEKADLRSVFDDTCVSNIILRHILISIDSLNANRSTQ